MLKIYSVQNGDTVQTIAQKHGVSLSALRKLNTELSETDQLTPGIKIKVPTESKPVKRKEISVQKKDEDTVPEMVGEGQQTEVIEVVQAPVQDELTVNLNSTTYTFKPSNVVPPTNPHNDGMIEFQYGEGAASSIPMMEDPFPDAMKQKYDGAQGQVTQEQPGIGYGQQQFGYPYGQQGGTGVYPGYPSSNYPYAVPYQQNAPSGYPYQQESVPYTQEGEVPQFGVPPYEQSNSYGYYGYAPVWQPNRNPLGCRAEDPYYGQTRDYYGQWYEQEPAPSYSYWAEPTYNQAAQNAADHREQNPYFYPNSSEQVNYNYFTQEEPYAPEQNIAVQPNYVYPEQSSSGYPAYPGYFEGTDLYNQSGPSNPYGYEQVPTYMSHQTPDVPDYSMWESYVDYHKPPFQPDFPVKPENKAGQ